LNYYQRWICDLEYLGKEYPSLGFTIPVTNSAATETAVAQGQQLPANFLNMSSKEKSVALLTHTVDHAKKMLTTLNNALATGGLTDQDKITVQNALDNQKKVIKATEKRIDDIRKGAKGPRERNAPPADEDDAGSLYMALQFMPREGGAINMYRAMVAVIETKRSANPEDTDIIVLEKALEIMKANIDIWREFVQEPLHVKFGHCAPSERATLLKSRHVCVLMSIGIYFSKINTAVFSLFRLRDGTSVFFSRTLLAFVSHCLR